MNGTGDWEVYTKAPGAEEAAVEEAAVVMEAGVLALAPVPVLAPEAEGQGVPERIFSGTYPDDMNYEALAQKARYFKQDGKGVATKCKIMEDMRNEAAQNAELNKAKKMAIRMIKAGKMSLEDIPGYTELSLDTVKELESQTMQLA